MSEFGTVIRRIESDFDFYLDFRSDPETTLAAFDLTPAERSALLSPTASALWVRLAGGVGQFEEETEIPGAPPSGVQLPPPPPPSEVDPPPPLQLPPPPPPPPGVHAEPELDRTRRGSFESNDSLLQRMVEAVRTADSSTRAFLVEQIIEEIE